MNRILRFAIVLCGLALLAAPTLAQASHFRGGTITWTRPSTSSRTVTFNVTHSWRVSPSISLVFGDGTSQSMSPYGLIGSFTDSTGLGYTSYQDTTTKTYGGSGANYTVYFRSCCRIGQLSNGANGWFRVESRVTLGGTNTASPAVGTAALLQMVRGAQNTVALAIVDPDPNESFSCAWSTTAQATTGSSSSPFRPSWLNLDPNTCVLTGTPPSSGNLWAYSLRVTDAYGGITTFDGMIEIVTGSPPTCTGGGNFNTSVGSPFTTSFVGSNPTGGNVTFSVTGQPSASSLSPTSGPSGTTSTFNWTPSASDFGQTYAATVIVTNSQNLQATCPLGLTVPLNQPPVVTTTGPYNGVNGTPTPVNGSATDPDGTIVSYEWDCNGDGVFEIGPQATAAAVCPALTSSGTYTITLRATDDAGGTSVVSTTITIPSLPPVANAGGPYTGNIAIPVALSGNGSSDPDGTIATYEWD
ncbi:MAG: PKD domain-containing protein, partial [Deltaproteobacteria bacterium]|nr:PKD domain-containing protein [Deltaproteobacteria bacterium]